MARCSDKAEKDMDINRHTHTHVSDKILRKNKLLFLLEHLLCY